MYPKRLFVLISAVLFPLSATYAQKPTPTPERPRAVVALLNDARLAAPELGVDTFLQIIEAKKVADPVWRKELLDEAWRMTEDVKYPVQRERAYFSNGAVDTAAGYLTNAYQQQLDTLSLQSRVIKNILASDKLRARQIVFQIGGDLRLKPLTCEDAMGYVVDDIYATVGEVAKAAFSSKEISEGVRGLFLVPWIDNIQSPSQIMPAFDLLNELSGPASERQMLIGAFERAINRNFGDDRSFSRAFYRDRYMALRLMSGLESSGEASSLTAAWRDFLVKNAAGPRCLDSKPGNKAMLPSPMNTFNTLLPEAKRFALQDFESVEYRGAPKDKLYLNSPTYKKVSLLFKTARDAKNFAEDRDDKAVQLEWQTKVSEVLEALDSWKASADETDAEVFNQKATFYRSMLPEVDDPPTKTTVTRAFLRFLAGSAVQKESFIEWLVHAKWLAGNQAELFNELAAEFPNPNFKVMLATHRVMAAPQKPAPASTDSFPKAIAPPKP